MISSSLDKIGILDLLVFIFLLLSLTFALLFLKKVRPSNLRKFISSLENSLYFQKPCEKFYHSNPTSIHSLPIQR